MKILSKLFIIHLLIGCGSENGTGAAPSETNNTANITASNNSNITAFACEISNKIKTELNNQELLDGIGNRDIHFKYFTNYSAVSTEYQTSACGYLGLSKIVSGAGPKPFTPTNYNSPPFEYFPTIGGFKFKSHFEPRTGLLVIEGKIGEILVSYMRQLEYGKPFDKTIYSKLLTSLVKHIQSSAWHFTEAKELVPAFCESRMVQGLEKNFGGTGGVRSKSLTHFFEGDLIEENQCNFEIDVDNPSSWMNPSNVFIESRKDMGSYLQGQKTIVPLVQISSNRLFGRYADTYTMFDTKTNLHIYSYGSTSEADAKKAFNYLLDFK